VSADLAGQDVIHPLEKRLSQRGPISILKGNLAEEGAVLKTVEIAAAEIARRREALFRLFTLEP
jgi:dihydroxyacid dehydratase/phosphogluconate dehydratase